MNWLTLFMLEHPEAVVAFMVVLAVLFIICWTIVAIELTSPPTKGGAGGTGAHHDTRGEATVPPARHLERVK